jgi:hypothetical protein
MNLSQAKVECESWFAHLRRQEHKTRLLQQLAGDRRMGVCGKEEGERRRAAIQSNGLTVYDGANLSVAVMVLLRAVADKEPKDEGDPK